MKQLRGYGGNNYGEGAERMYYEAMRKYGNMSEDALVSKLIQTVREQKQNGTFDEVQLLGFVNTIAPHLSSEQRQRLESLLGMIED